MSAAAGAFGLAALAAAGDWWSRAPRAPASRARAVEYACKPATLAFLVIAAVALHPAAGAHGRRAWFVAALVCSLAGDVALMLPADRFVAGLGAFLVAHLCYLAGFFTHGPPAAALALAAAAVAVAVLPVAHRILGALGDAGEPRALRGAVTAYVAVIAAMLATALASGNLLGGGGAALFVASDTMIAWDRFVRRCAWAPVAIMVTYHLGQAGLVASLLR